MTFATGELMVETAANPSTGDFIVLGAEDSFLAILTQIGADNTFFYSALGVTSGKREWGLGTVRTGPTRVERTTPYGTSDDPDPAAPPPSKIDFATETVKVWGAIPQRRSVMLGASGYPADGYGRPVALAAIHADTGAADAYVITPNPEVAELVAGQVFEVDISAANTGAATLKIGAHAALAIKRRDGATDPEADEIPAGLNKFKYDGSVVRHLGAAGAGKLVQRQVGVYTTYASTGLVIPVDNTKPQIGEGAEGPIVGITPKKATNGLVVRCGAILGGSVAGTITLALFRDAVADALRAASADCRAPGASMAVGLEYSNTAGGIAEITFRLRYGPDTGTAYINGRSTGALYGGAAAAFIIAEEYST